MVTTFDLSEVFEIVDHSLVLDDTHVLLFPPTSWASHSHLGLFLIGSLDSFAVPQGTILPLVN